jgi:hypothetical protein
MYPSFLRLFTLLVCLCAVATGTAPAFESRLWITAEGQLIEGTLTRSVGDLVEVEGKERRITRLSRATLGPADAEYLDANAPQEKKPLSAGAAKIPNPAKIAKVDRSQFKVAGELKIAVEPLQVCDTPHFRILFKDPSEPLDLAELAERIWLDAAFFYAGFREKWHDRKMAIIMVNDDRSLKEFITWARDNNYDNGFDRTSPYGTGGFIHADGLDAGLFSYVRLIPGCSAGRIPQPLKGVWRSFWVNMLATDMLRIHTGNGTPATPEGRMALIAGTAYQREILFTGRAETMMLSLAGDGKNLTPVQNFTPKPWAAEMKSLMKKKDSGWTPKLEALFKARENEAGSRDVAFAWAFARFQQSTPARLLAFSNLCRKTDEAQSVPELAEIAQLYGFASASAMEKAWIEWMNSTEFR